MKLIKNIGWSFLFLLVSLVSCDKAETERIHELPDTDIPEGYMRVTFPAEKLETRAVNGQDGRISHLRYLVYKKGDQTTYKLYKNDVVFNNSSGTKVNWPYKDLSIYLPINSDYKVVFLGNVDKSLFKDQTGELLSGAEVGTNSYEDARIVSPSVSFNEGTHNLYYWANCSFNTNVEGNADKTMTIKDVLMQRIVSRCRLSGYGIKDGTQDVGIQNDYSSCFYYSLLNDDALLGEKVLGSTGKMGYWFLEMLKKDFIYPVAYMLNIKSNLDQSSEAGKWFQEIGGENYLNTDNYLNAEGIKNYLTVIVQDDGWNSYINPKAIALNQFISDLVNDTDPKGYIKNMTAQIKTDNIKNLALGTLSYSGAKQKTADALKSAQAENAENKFLATWASLQGGAYSMKINLNSTNVPQALDLDLNVQESSSITDTKTVELQLATIDKANYKYEDMVLNLYSLGDKTGNSKFGFTSLSLNDNPVYALPEEAFPFSESLAPNKSLDFRTVPTDIQLGDGKATEAIKICFVYQHLINAISKDLPSPFDATEIAHVFNDALKAITSAGRDVILDDAYGRLDKGNNNSQTGFNFYVPDFSYPNFTGKLEWKMMTD